jgi:hypothetical protein
MKQYRIDLVRNYQHVEIIHLLLSGLGTFIINERYCIKHIMANTCNRKKIEVVTALGLRDDPRYENVAPNP